MSAPSIARLFDYEVVNPDGKHIKGRLEGTTSEAVAEALSQTGVVPISVQPASAGLRRELKIPGLGNRVTTDDLATFARQFATMIESGLTLMHSLSILEAQSSKPKLCKAIGEVQHEIEGGLSLSKAMARHDRVFPLLMVALVAAGETGGFLDQALDRIADTLEKEAGLRAKIKAALTYPVIVLCFSVLMIAGVLVFIVPVFERMFSQLGGNLPLPTRVMVDLSHQMFWIIPLLAVTAVSTTIYVRRRLRADESWRYAFDKAKLAMPVFGELFTKIAIVRFSRNLGTLLGVGVPVMQSLDMVADTTGNAVLVRAVHEIKIAVRDGRPISEPLLENPYFPPMLSQMVRVGEETGQITTMLNKVADFYSREVDTATEQLTAAIEPIMVVGMGAIIGVMVICLYLPMFTIYQAINNQGN